MCRPHWKTWKKMWIMQSNRWKHLLGGFAIGAACSCFYDALIASAATGAAMEWKDRSWGGKFDWADLACTLAGGAIGGGLRYLIFQLW